MTERAITGQVNSPGRSSSFTTGDRVFFQQTTPSAGWTKESSSTYDDAGIRLQTGTVVTGGTDAWSVTHTSSKATDSHTLTTAELASHPHTQKTHTSGSGGFTTAAGQNAGSGDWTNSLDTASAGSGNGHVHTMQTDLKFAECSIGIRD